MINQDIVVTYKAWNNSTQQPALGDGANHTLQSFLGLGEPLATIPGTPEELAEGNYAILVPGSMNVMPKGTLIGSSSTPGIVIFESKWDNEQDFVAGADQVLVTLTNTTLSQPIRDANVWVTFDQAGLYIADGPKSVNSAGQVKFLLDHGTTYYLWMRSYTSASVLAYSFVATATLAVESTAISSPSGLGESYNTLISAGAYLATKLYTRPWDNSSPDKRQKALNEARNIINRFAFDSVKLVEDQLNEFPRIDYDPTPNDILYAEAEIALALLGGADPERDLRQSFVTSRGYSSVRTTYDTDRIPEHLQVGVPSAAAWAYLSPYLQRNGSGTVLVRRVS
jgi:hypothetical protein